MSELNNILDRIKSSDKLELQLVTWELDTILSGLSKDDLLKKHNEILQDISDWKFKYEGNSEDIEIVFSQRINDYKKSEQAKIDYKEPEENAANKDKFLNNLWKKINNYKKSKENSKDIGVASEKVEDIHGESKEKTIKKEVKVDVPNVKVKSEIKVEKKVEVQVKKKEIKKNNWKDAYLYEDWKLVWAEFKWPFNNISEHNDKKEENQTQNLNQMKAIAQYSSATLKEQEENNHKKIVEKELQENSRKKQNKKPKVYEIKENQKSNSIIKKEINKPNWLPSRVKNYKNVARKEEKKANKEWHIDWVKILKGEERTIVWKDNKNHDRLVMKALSNKKRIKKIFVDENLFIKLFVKTKKEEIKNIEKALPSRITKYEQIEKWSLLEISKNSKIDNISFVKWDTWVLLGVDDSNKNNIIIRLYKNGEYASDENIIDENQFKSLFLKEKKEEADVLKDDVIKEKQESKENKSEVKQVVNQNIVENKINDSLASEDIIQLKIRLLWIKKNKPEESLKFFWWSWADGWLDYKKMKQSIFDEEYTRIVSRHTYGDSQRDAQKIWKEIIDELSVVRKYRYKKKKRKEINQDKK